MILRTEPCCPFPPILRAEAQQQLPRGIMANFGQLFLGGGGQCIQRERSSRMKSKSVTLNLNLGYFICRIPERFKVTLSLCYSYRRGEPPPLRKLDFAPEASPPPFAFCCCTRERRRGGRDLALNTSQQSQSSRPSSSSFFPLASRKVKEQGNCQKKSRTKCSRFEQDFYRVPHIYSHMRA